MNKHVLTGRPTADPEVSYFGKDGEQKMMAKFTLASNHLHDKDADFSVVWHLERKQTLLRSM